MPNKMLGILCAQLFSLVLQGCSDYGVKWGDNNTVYTPIYRDNRAFFLQRPSAGGTSQRLVGLSDGTIPESEAVPRNSPLSIIMRSVEIPSDAPLIIGDKTYKSKVNKAADYVVVLDVGTSNNGDLQSIAVWYQRGVQPGQSLNFSNLLVYYEQRWDERVAPYFRIRVIEVTKEKNEETRRMLERANNMIRATGIISANPSIIPLAGVAMAAAGLVLANKENRALLDYTVQLYSMSASSASGSADLGILRRGSYIVVGKPEEESKAFWNKATALSYETVSRSLTEGTAVVNVPTALISVGTFDSIVPKIVLERSAALNALLLANGKDSSIEQINVAAKQLSASVTAFSWAEKVTRYNDRNDVTQILNDLQTDDMPEYLSADDKFNVLRVISKCFDSDTVMTEAEARAYSDSHPGQKCEG